MKGMHSSKAHNVDKPFPGCLGRMVNLFDLSSGFSGNKLLTDKPHRDGNFSYNSVIIEAYYKSKLKEKKPSRSLT